MGTKYSSVSVSGYNSSPPADDGSTSASNQVTWANIKTKLPDPLNTAIAAINSGLVTAFDYSARSISTSDSALAGDHMKTIEIASTVSSVVTVTLSDAASMAAGYSVSVCNRSNYDATITRATASDVIDNTASSVTLPSKQSAGYKVNASLNGYLTTYRGTITNVTSSSGGITSSPQGRLTLTTAVPVTTADVTGATTLYYTPYCGNQVPIYNGSAFAMTTFAELSQATTDATKSPAAVAASKVYDLFVWSDGGTIRCTRGPAWTNDTTPGTGAGTSELQMINGIMTNKVAITNGPGANLGTYVGTVRSDASSQLNDSVLLRYVANAYNAVDRNMVVVDTTDSWTYTTATWRQARATSSNQVAYVSPQLPFVNLVEANCQSVTQGGAGNPRLAVGVGVDSTSTNSAQILGSAAVQTATFYTDVVCSYKGYPGIGAHTLVWLEISEVSGGTTTWYGDGGFAYIQSGLVGCMKG